MTVILYDVADVQFAVE